MELYFYPLACSLASRIALYEAEAPVRFIEVDAKSKRTLESNESFCNVHPLGLVPVLRTDAGEILTENAAVLQYIADAFPAAQLAPASGIERSRLHEWLCFIGTELHKGLFVTLLDERAGEAAKQYAIERGRPRLEYLDRRLQGRDFLLDGFSVADAYLSVVLSWSAVTPIKLSTYPSIHAYLERLRKRPSIARAFAEELPLFQQEQARHGKPPLTAAAG